MSAKNTTWFSVRNAAREDTGPVEILIYDKIGKDWFDGSGVEAGAFAEALREIPKDRDIVVGINSPGGNVWDGLAIYHQLQMRGDRVTTRIDGLAASIASVIALAGREVSMPKEALYMIHDPSGLVMGTAEDARKLAIQLDAHGDAIADVYAAKAGGSRKDWREKMRAETWFNGDQAFQSKLVDRTTNAKPMKASFDLTNFRRVPEALGEANPPANPQNTQNMNDTVQPTAKAGDAVTPPPVQPKDQSQTVTVTDGKPPVAPTTATTNTQDQKIVDLEKRLKAAEERRITSEFKAVADANPAIDAAYWLPKVIKDESLLDGLKAMPVPEFGTPPKGPGVVNLGIPVIEDYNKTTPGKQRLDFIRNHLPELTRERVRLTPNAPRAANTYDADLVTDMLASAWITIATNKLAPVSAFTTNFGVDPMKPLSVVQVRKMTVGATAQTNATNFESGDTTSVNIPVTVAQKTVSWHVTNAELQSGHQMVHAAEISANSMANAISDVYTAIMTAANYGTAITIGVAANFDAADLPPIYAAAKNFKAKNLLLDGGHLAYLLPTNRDEFAIGERRAYGFDLIVEQNRWTGAETNTQGFVCGPEAIAVASGLPVGLPTGEYLSAGSASSTQGLTLQTASWFNTAGRVFWMSYDIMIGAAAGDVTQAEVLITA